jgi:hypothetical protein
MLFLILFTLEDGTGRLDRNVGNELPLLAAEHPRRAQISYTSWRKPEIMQGGAPFGYMKFGEFLDWLRNY